MSSIEIQQFKQAVGNADEINELLRRYGVKFGIYKNDVTDNRNYADLLKETMDNVNCGGIRAILTPYSYYIQKYYLF